MWDLGFLFFPPPPMCVYNSISLSRVLYTSTTLRSCTTPKKPAPSTYCTYLTIAAEKHTRALQTRFRSCLQRCQRNTLSAAHRREVCIASSSLLCVLHVQIRVVAAFWTLEKAHTTFSWVHNTHA